ncbi:hypothetical protein HK405_004407 [Cladochytrium tenue]|nr:hypothetical protein HK405_004407 [Cladochytrium tenue]
MTSGRRRAAPAAQQPLLVPSVHTVLVALAALVVALWLVSVLLWLPGAVLAAIGALVYRAWSALVTIATHVLIACLLQAALGPNLSRLKAAPSPPKRSASLKAR